MSAALMFLPYLPTVSWLVNFMSYEEATIEQMENFIKATDRNRANIAGANGEILLTIPLEGGREKRQKYKEVKISYKTDWQNNHWQSIISAYGSTPFFEYYSDRLQAFYQNRYEFLFEYNLALLHTIFSMLRIEKEIVLTSIFEKTVLGKMDLRGKNEDDTLTLPRYYQVFEERHGFIANLSIIDLIFHLGPESEEYLLAVIKNRKGK